MRLSSRRLLLPEWGVPVLALSFESDPHERKSPCHSQIYTQRRYAFSRAANA